MENLTIEMLNNSFGSAVSVIVLFAHLELFPDDNDI